MKTRLPAILLTGLLSIHGGNSDAGPGSPDYENTYANVGVMIIFDFSPSVPPPNVSTFCSGVLISPLHFLTAAHCIDWISTVDNPQVGVSFANFAVPDLSTTIPVVAWHMHPDYPAGLWTSTGANPGIGGTARNDIGILVLESGHTVNLGLVPATLPDEGHLDSLRRSGALQQADIVNLGYGVVPTSTGAPGYLPPDGIRRVSTSRFTGLTRDYLKQRINLHAGDSGGSSQGDSGSPKFLVGDLERTILAITSWGDPPSRAMISSVRVDTRTALDFIRGIKN